MADRTKKPLEKSQRYAKIVHLNETAVLMMEPELPEEERKKLCNEVVLLSYQLYDDKTMEFLEAVLVACKKYNPNLGRFSAFLKTIHENKLKDKYRKEPEAKNINIVSLYSPISEENSLTLEDVTENKQSPNPANGSPLLDRKLTDLTAQILNFAERHHGKTANEVRRRWFRMFYTEDMTMACKETELAYVHERDVFAAMELDYLDYYMLRPCRRLPDLSVTPLKPYHEIVPAQQSLEEPPIPLPADISIAFWQICKGERKTPAARSQQYKAYRTEVKELFL